MPLGDWGSDRRGRERDALNTATAGADAFSDEIAMIGSAVRVMRLPTALTACAAHSLRKSACAHKDDASAIAPFTDR
jgi:hypothetical protein